MCANKKIQDISMKAAIGNHQILGLPIVSQRPLRVICDRPLYGKQFCVMEFIGLPGRDSRQFQVNGGLTLKSGHSLLLMLCRG